MGFFDSLKVGFGRALGDIGGQLLGAGVQALGGLIFGKPKASGSPWPNPGQVSTVRVPNLESIRQETARRAATGVDPRGFPLPTGPRPSTRPIGNFSPVPQFLREEAALERLDRRRGITPGLTPIFQGGSQVAFPTSRGTGFSPALFDLDVRTGVGGRTFDPALSAGGGTPMFRQTMAGARAMFFRAPNPVTGQDTWFRPAGRPILWSGDLRACKRVNKVARRARRSRPR